MIATQIIKMVIVEQIILPKFGLAMTSKTKRRTTLLAASPVPKVMRLIKQYKDAGRMNEVYQITDGIIARNTLLNWLKSPTAISNAYKASALQRIAHALPSLQDRKAYDAYTFALDELRLDRSSQIDLRKYHGLYKVHHRLVGGTMDTIVLNAAGAPRTATFWFRFESRGKTYLCDGLVILRQNRLYLMGLAESSMFSAHINAVSRPDSDLLTGIAIFENFNEEKLSASRIVLTGSSQKLTEPELEYISSYLRGDTDSALSSFFLDSSQR